MLAAALLALLAPLAGAADLAPARPYDCAALTDPARLREELTRTFREAKAYLPDASSCRTNRPGFGGALDEVLLAAEAARSVQAGVSPQGRTTRSGVDVSRFAFRDSVSIHKEMVLAALANLSGAPILPALDERDPMMAYVRERALPENADDIRARVMMLRYLYDRRVDRYAVAVRIQDAAFILRDMKEDPARSLELPSVRPAEARLAQTAHATAAAAAAARLSAGAGVNFDQGADGRAPDLAPPANGPAAASSPERRTRAAPASEIPAAAPVAEAPAPLPIRPLSSPVALDPVLNATGRPLTWGEAVGKRDHSRADAFARRVADDARGYTHHCYGAVMSAMVSERFVSVADLNSRKLQIGLSDAYMFAEDLNLDPDFFDRTSFRRIDAAGVPWERLDPVSLKTLPGMVAVYSRDPDASCQWLQVSRRYNQQINFSPESGHIEVFGPETIPDESPSDEAKATMREQGDLLACSDGCSKRYFAELAAWSALRTADGKPCVNLYMPVRPLSPRAFRPR